MKYDIDIKKFLNDKLLYSLEIIIYLMAIYNDISFQGEFTAPSTHR